MLSKVLSVALNIPPSSFIWCFSYYCIVKNGSSLFLVHFFHMWFYRAFFIIPLFFLPFQVQDFPLNKSWRFGNFACVCNLPSSPVSFPRRDFYSILHCKSLSLIIPVGILLCLPSNSVDIFTDWSRISLNFVTSLLLCSILLYIICLCVCRFFLLTVF